MVGGKRKIRIGMMGGGIGAGIAPTHRAAIRLDGEFELVAGCFSRDMERSLQTAENLGILQERVYQSTEEMASKEASRADGIEVVSIVTPQDIHFAAAIPFLKRGIHVICDKPLASTLQDAEALFQTVETTGSIFALTHNYSAYSMVRHGRELVATGVLGDITMIQVEHASGWGAARVEASGRKQAVWRTDPSQAGMASIVFDLGTHAHQLLRFISGLEVAEVTAELATHVEGRAVYDNAQMLLRLSNGGRGSLWVTMAATGHEHGLRIRVYGTKASLDWSHEDAQHLHVRHLGGRKETFGHGQAGLSEAAAVKRVGFGHPEGFIESFANIYREVAEEIRCRADGGAPVFRNYPSVRDGLIGIDFVTAAVQSHDESGRWVSLPSRPPLTV